MWVIIITVWWALFTFLCDEIEDFSRPFFNGTTENTRIYSYESAIPQGYGDFTPFIAKKYTLAKRLFPIVPLESHCDSRSHKKLYY
jgi:hypothetical protein